MKPDRGWIFGFVLALLVQTATLFYWGGTITEAVKTNRRDISEIKQWKNRHQEMAEKEATK